MTRIAVLLTALASALSWAAQNPPDARNDAPATPPYPASAFIGRIDWDWPTRVTAAAGSDLWPVTWGPDDNLYTAWGDGGGFGGSDSDGRVSMGFARIEGGPEKFRGVNINGGKAPEHPASFLSKGKTAGLAFVDGTLYATVNLQDSPWPDVSHALAWSSDRGATWTRADWVFSKGTGRFQPTKFINFGRDYNGVPYGLQGNVYLIGPEQSSKPTGLFLARVSKTRVRDQAAYEYFTDLGPDGRPKWAAAFSSAHPIFSDPNGVAVAGIGYAPALRRFILSAYHTGPGQLGLFEAPNPWGPWATFCYEEHWGAMGKSGEGLSCEFPQKWMSTDGLELWAVFSVYGGSAKEGINAHDRFNLIRAKLWTKNRTPNAAIPRSSSQTAPGSGSATMIADPR